MAVDEFDSKVRAPLWYAIYDSFGKEKHDTWGSEWPEPYKILHEALKRSLGRWELSIVNQASGNAIRDFIQTATKEEIVETIRLAESIGEFSKVPRLEFLRRDLAEIRKRVDEITERRLANDSEERWWDTAQVCLNGHIVNRQSESHPEANTKHCKVCGAETLMKCKHCNTAIHGYKHIPRGSHIDDSPPPKFCHECGKPYPWTISQRDAAESYIEELEGLSDADKSLLRGSIDDIIRDTPRTETALVRIKKVLPRLGPEARDVMKKLLVNLATEAVKESLQ
jgi:hypothetical protein